MSDNPNDRTRRGIYLSAYSDSRASCDTDSRALIRDATEHVIGERSGHLRETMINAAIISPHHIGVPQPSLYDAIWTKTDNLTTGAVHYPTYAATEDAIFTVVYSLTKGCDMTIDRALDQVTDR